MRNVRFTLRKVHFALRKSVFLVGVGGVFSHNEVIVLNIQEKRLSLDAFKKLMDLSLIHI